MMANSGMVRQELTSARVVFTARSMFAAPFTNHQYYYSCYMQRHKHKALIWDVSLPSSSKGTTAHARSCVSCIVFQTARQKHKCSVCLYNTTVRCHSAGAITVLVNSWLHGVTQRCDTHESLRGIYVNTRHRDFAAWGRFRQFFMMDSERGSMTSS